MSDATVRAALRRVEEAHAQRQAGLITKEAYDDLQQWLGFNRLQFNPFADPALNLAAASNEFGDTILPAMSPEAEQLNVIIRRAFEVNVCGEISISVYSAEAFGEMRTFGT